MRFRSFEYKATVSSAAYIECQILPNIMCTEDFFLSLKENQELFNFVQQAAMLLLFASGVLCYFAFKTNEQLEHVQEVLQSISLALWAVTLILCYFVVMSYIKERHYRKEKNAWGETIYQSKERKIIQKEKDKKIERTHRSIDSLSLINETTAILKTNTNDIVVNVHIEE